MIHGLRLVFNINVILPPSSISVQSRIQHKVVAPVKNMKISLGVPLYWLNFRFKLVNTKLQLLAGAETEVIF